MFFERSTHITLSVAVASISIVLGLTSAALGQLEPDETLGEERSQVREISPVDFDIEGGARRGNNLFHSFREFNVSEGGSVYFVNPDGIQNILSRVTGGNPSNILGRLGVFGNANLFLINPNGIVFGPNASLDVRGSFTATTADGIQFGEQGFFSATNPETPGLLTVNPSALFFNQLEAQPIVNRSQTLIGTTPLGVELFGLNVPSRRSLVLAGGDVFMDGGINAIEGRVEIGGLAGSGQINLIPVSDGFQLQFPSDAVRSDVFLSGATVNVAGGDRGNIAIYAQDLTLTNGSFLRGGYDAGLGTATSQAGNILLDATGTILIDQFSTVVNLIRQGAIGNAGDININAASLTVNENGYIGNGVIGQGSGGNININVNDRIAFDNGFIFNNSYAGAIGDAGNIILNADSVALSNGTQINGSTLGQGNAGNINITARNAVSSHDAAIFSTALASATNAIGNGGNITINAGSVNLLNGTQLDSSTFRQGNSGDITIGTRDRVSLSGVNGEGVASAIYSSVAEGAIGNGGNITIEAGSFALTDSGLLISETRGQGNAGNVMISARDTVSLDGFSNNRLTSAILSETTGEAIGNAGNITIEAGSVSLTNGFQLNTGTRSQGNAGNITITAQDRVLFDGTNSQGFSSTAFSSVFENGIGNSGNITIEAGSVSLTNGAQLASRTDGQGNAGDINITAHDAVSLSSTTTRLSFIDSGVKPEGTGRGGTINITAGSLLLANGSFLLAATSGTGDAGTVNLNIRDRISLQDPFSNISTNVSDGGIGNAGSISINAGSLFLSNRSSISASALGQGDGGDITITARNRVSLDNASIGSSPFATVSGRAGNITINTGSFSATNRLGLTTTTFGQGNAGNIRIVARDRVSFTQGASAISTVDSNASANGGDITIIADSLFLEGGSQLGTSSLGRGNSGDIRISTRSLAARNGGQITVSTFGRGDAGNIVIDADRIVFDGLGNQLFSGAFSTVEGNARGNGQDIRINTGTLAVNNGARISAATITQGNAGNIRIVARDSIIIDGVHRSGYSSALFSSTFSTARGRGGTINLNTDLFRVFNGAIVSAATDNSFRGGDVVINANTIEALNGGQILTTTSRAGRAGDISLNADRILLSGTDATYRQRLREFGRTVVFNQGENSGLFANTRSNSTGNGGRITMNSNNLTLEDGARISAQSQGTGMAGEIRLNVSEQLQLTDSDIVTNAPRSSGGDISVNAGSESGITILRGDSDITTNSQGNGGNITLQGSGIIAFDDSDILARSQDARGGNITLAPFFSANPAFESEAPFDGNGRVDVNADGSIAAGTITTPDTSLIQNSLTDLPESAIDTDNLVANSCVVRSQEQSGTFIIAGAEGLPQRPGDAPLPSYATGTVRSAEESADEPIWQMGDPIVEPQGMYRLQDGRMVLSREC